MGAHTGQRGLASWRKPDGRTVEQSSLGTGGCEVPASAIRCTCSGVFHTASDLGNPLKKYCGRKGKISGEFWWSSMPQEIDFCKC